MRSYEEELETLIKAGARVVEIASFEWERVHGFTNYVAEILGIDWYSWSSVSGLKVWEEKGFKIINPDCVTLPAVLDVYLQYKDNMLLVLEDFHSHSEANHPVNIRWIREMMRPQNYLGDYKKAIILSSPSKFVPEELSKELPVIEVELPDRPTIEIIANQVVDEYRDVCFEKDITPKLLTSALGLTVMEARLAFAKAIITNRKLTEDEIPLIISEKEQIIKKSGLLEYFHPKEYLTHVGGLENLKDWIKKRGNAYSDEAKEYGLNTPRGVLLLGVPGCGKSLTAKAIANEWKFPLLRFDLGKVFGGFVGESERNIRYALDVAKTISPCVLWIDEIEKGLSGTQSSGRTDGGTSARVFGTFLTWMQEKKEPVFVVATANDISLLPPELLRKGRFDEIFFVDLPSEKERENIFHIHLKIKNRDAKQLNLDMEKLVKESEGFSGAEIEEVVNEALFNAYANGQKDLEMKNLLECINATSPLSRTMAETITNLRAWADKRARKASEDEPGEAKELDKKVPRLQQEYKNPFITKKSHDSE
ncbi:MAG TPA: AAA family ATPase [Planctomycetota bacterium]|nr:AAA family ATPase [Planctomycetota bacterium]HPY75178.1 AAA family ATPase [Planctomycetota bacterium]HQB01080.1 AAA family ATPase [Planctomycetota bacterium]